MSHHYDEDSQLCIWLIEDNAAFRSSLAKSIQLQRPKWKVICFGDAVKSIEAIKGGSHVDCVLLDIGLPKLDGITAIKRLKTTDEDLVILMLTVFAEEEKIMKALGAGAIGYLLKNETPLRIVESIEQAVKGHAYLTPEVASVVLRQLKEGNQNATEQEQHNVPEFQLTERERAVLGCLCNGMSRKQIARHLNMNPHTSDYILRCLYRKLGVSNVAEAVAISSRYDLA